MTSVANDGVVYVIIHPITREIHYVGQTMNFARRKRRHLSQAKTPKTAIHSWIKAIKENDLEPEFVLLERVAADQLNRLETFYVSYFSGQGCRLKNLTGGGDGVRGYRWSDEAKQRQSEKLKSVWKDPAKSQRISAGAKSFIGA